MGMETCTSCGGGGCANCGYIGSRWKEEERPKTRSRNPPPQSSNGITNVIAGSLVVLFGVAVLNNMFDEDEPRRTTRPAVSQPQERQAPRPVPTPPSQRPATAPQTAEPPPRQTQPQPAPRRTPPPIQAESQEAPLMLGVVNTRDSYAEPDGICADYFEAVNMTCLYSRNEARYLYDVFSRDALILSYARELPVKDIIRAEYYPMNNAMVAVTASGREYFIAQGLKERFQDRPARVSTLRFVRATDRAVEAEVPLIIVNEDLRKRSYNSEVANPELN